MAFYLACQYDKVKTLRAVVRQWSQSTSTPGQYWNQTTPGWQAGLPGSGDQLAMTEDAGTPGAYTFGAASLGTYTGKAKVYYYDSLITDPIGHEVIDMVAGHREEESLPPEWRSGGSLQTDLAQAADGGGAAVVISPDIISPARTWVVPRDGSECPTVRQVVSGSKVTMAVDFSNLVNPQTGNLTVEEITDSLALLDFTSQAVNQNRMQVHFTLDDLVSGNLHTITVIANTTDGQKLGARCRLRVL